MRIFWWLPTILMFCSNCWMGNVPISCTRIYQNLNGMGNRKNNKFQSRALCKYLIRQLVTLIHLGGAKLFTDVTKTISAHRYKSLSAANAANRLGRRAKKLNLARAQFARLRPKSGVRLWPLTRLTKDRSSFTRHQSRSLSRPTTMLLIW